MKTLHQLSLFVLAALLLAACADTFAPAPTPAATATPPAPIARLTEPDLGRGQQVFLDKQCLACHGPRGEGGIGGVLAGTTKSFADFQHVVRTALPPKPAFNEVELSSQDVYNVYGWLLSLGQAAAAGPVPTPVLEPGKILGMTLWTEGRCDTCHGSFAQGSAGAPPLAGLTFPYEMERAKMRQTAGEIPEHAAEHMRDEVLKRLYQWLQAGANPGDGC